MRRINLLLASAERRTTNALEAAVLDVCYDQAVVEITRTARVDELVQLGSRDGVDLVVVAVDHILAEPSRRNAVVSAAEVIRAIEVLRHQRSTPLLAVTVSADNEPALIAAGADCVSVGLVLHTDQIKADLRRMLSMSELVETAPSSRWSVGGWLRGYQRLKTAA